MYNEIALMLEITYDTIKFLDKLTKIGGQYKL